MFDSDQNFRIYKFLMWCEKSCENFPKNESTFDIAATDNPVEPFVQWLSWVIKDKSNTEFYFHLVSWSKFPHAKWLKIENCLLHLPLKDSSQSRIHCSLGKFDLDRFHAQLQSLLGSPAHWIVDHLKEIEIFCINYLRNHILHLFSFQHKNCL